MNNRNDEFDKIKNTLDNDIVFLPKDDYGGIMKKLDKYKTRKKVVNSVVSSFCAFALVVNIFPSVAYAMYDIPFIGDLAKVVSFSTSLSKAVEENHVQYIGKSQTKDGITVTLEHLIVDQKRMHLFFTAIDQDGNSVMSSFPEIKWDNMTENDKLGGSLSENGNHIKETNDKSYWVYIKDFEDTTPTSIDISIAAKSYSSQNLDDDAKYEEYSMFTAYPHFSSENFDDELLKQHEHLVGAHFDFNIDIDPQFIETNNNYQRVNKTFEIEGQKLTIIGIETYPSHIKFIVEEDEQNTAYVRGLEFYLENEKGEKINQLSSGLISESNPYKLNQSIYYMESDYFSNSEKLTLNIEYFELLDKDKEFVKVDLKNGEFEWLPQGMKFIGVSKGISDNVFINGAVQEIPCYLIEFSYDNNYQNSIMEVKNANKDTTILTMTAPTGFGGMYKTESLDTENFINFYSKKNGTDNSTIVYYIEEEKYSDIFYMSPSFTGWCEFYANPIQIPLI